MIFYYWCCLKLASLPITISVCHLLFTEMNTTKIKAMKESRSLMKSQRSQLSKCFSGKSALQIFPIVSTRQYDCVYVCVRNMFVFVCCHGAKNSGRK